jgi:hypothetical protein
MTKLTVTKYSEDLKDFLDGATLSDAILQLQRWIQIYGSDAKVHIGEDRVPYEDYYEAYLKIGVEREETDEEYSGRLRTEESLNATKEQQERALYAQLKAKFGA